MPDIWSQLEQSRLSHVALGAVIAGGVQTLTLIIQACGAARQRTREHEHRQRQRLEEMSAKVAECIRWAQQLYHTQHWEQLEARTPPDATDRIVTLARLYFPAMEQSAIVFHGAMVDFYKACVRAFDPEQPHSVGTQIEYAANAGDERLAQLKQLPATAARVFDAVIVAEMRSLRNQS